MTEGQVQGTDAAALFANMIEMARLQRLSVTDLFGYAEARVAAGAHAEAIEVYKAWLAYNEAHPLLHLVYFNYAVTVRQAGDLTGSIHALRMAIKLDPKFGHAQINLGRAYEDAGLGVLAINQWRSFIELTAEATPDKVTHRVMVLQHIGRVMENAGLLEEAEPYMWQAIELRPDKLETGQHWSAIRQRLCKWPILTPSDHVSLRQLIDALSPLSLGSYSDDPIFQLAKAYRYNKSLVGRPDTSKHPRKAIARKVGTGARLRVGYVSSDLRDHAVGFALREVLELHDKDRVEIYAYYCGDPVVNDPTQNRMKAAIDCWREIGSLTDEDAARLIAADDIDILIDVNGYTKHARTRIFAYRPAPVIVNFCGYPGSMASPFHQYMITDELVVPEENRIYYSEKVKYIPCTQPVDRKRLIAAKPSRKEAGLPEKAFVYACFNGMQKITEATFGQWMQILSSVPKSVLWILTGGDSADQRLRDLAKAAGIEPERIIFAPKAGNAQHLARVGVADLFLDTFPYGAHSTAADALTVGLPVLTFPGKTFAARFCHSIVHAAGLSDLICTGPADYVARAISFGRDPKSLQKVRDQLAANREASVLRDMPGLARRLEDIYWEMQEEAERGETPVPDLRNMDVYYEVGAELVQANLVYQDEAAYRAQYLDRLAALHDFAPIPFDDRLWTAEAAARR